MDKYALNLDPWVEAKLIADPIPQKDLDKPRVLVKRNISDLSGPNGECLNYFPGYPTISLFTGAGGFDIGLEQAGFIPVVQHELDKGACETLIVNRPRYFRHSSLIQGNICNTPTSMILREAGLRVGEPYLLVGGPPCQGYSSTTRHLVKKNGTDTRNDLVFQFLRVIRESQPKYFIFENVPGFQTFNKGEYFEEFLKVAYSNYYELVYGLIDCSEYGVPQHRVRFICAGTRKDLFEIDGTLASLPSPENFAQVDLDKINILDAGPLFKRELESVRRTPGIRYFPDRPVLKTPTPTSTKSNGHLSRSIKFYKFYDDLEKNEPDRLVHSG